MKTCVRIFITLLAFIMAVMPMAVFATEDISEESDTRSIDASIIEDVATEESPATLEPESADIEELDEVIETSEESSMADDEETLEDGDISAREAADFDEDVIKIRSIDIAKDRISSAIAKRQSDVYIADCKISAHEMEELMYGTVTEDVSAITFITCSNDQYVESAHLEYSDNTENLEDEWEDDGDIFNEYGNTEDIDDADDFEEAADVNTIGENESIVEVVSSTNELIENVASNNESSSVDTSQSFMEVLLWILARLKSIIGAKFY